jgi:hypothetical protein
MIDTGRQKGNVNDMKVGDTVSISATKAEVEEGEEKEDELIGTKFTINSDEDMSREFQMKNKTNLSENSD